MRNKIIAVNAVIVIVVGLLSYGLMRISIDSASTNMEMLLADGKHDAQGAAARIQLDGLRAERWLAARASDPGTAEPVGPNASPSGRGDKATSIADGVMAAAKGSPAFEGRLPSLVAIVDAQGRVVGRNGSSLSRGDDLGAIYRPLKDAIAAGQSGSDIWVDKGRNDSYLASYAPLRDEAGKPVGALVVGMPLNDVLSRASDFTTGRGLAVAAPVGEKWDVVARTNKVSPALVDAVTNRPGETVKQAADTGHAAAALAGSSIAAAAPLEGFGDGKRGAIVADAPASRLENASAIPGSLLGVMGLGVLLVIVGGWMLGSYIDRPINMLEEGLLAILNGQHDKRFELEHAELGGLAFRIDQLLNQLMGVEEDTTDDEGRPSKAPSAADYKDAMSVDRSGAAGGGAGEEAIDPAAAARLAAEAEGDYHGRLYGEYINAKRALGEETSHITREAFVGRIQGMEREAAQKYGRAGRYQVKATGKEVVLIAVPLP